MPGSPAPLRLTCCCGAHPRLWVVPCVRVPSGGKGRTKSKQEWFNKASSRIWRGSLKSHDWRHLGRGAWEPRKAPAGKGSKSKRGGGGSAAGGGGAAGGSSRSRKQKQKQQRSRKGSCK